MEDCSEGPEIATAPVKGPEAGKPAGEDEPAPTESTVEDLEREASPSQVSGSDAAAGPAAAADADAAAPQVEQPVVISSDAAAGPAAVPDGVVAASETEEPVAISSDAAAGPAAAPDADAAAPQIEEPVAISSDAVAGLAAAPDAAAAVPKTEEPVAISSDAAAGVAALKTEEPVAIFSDAAAGPAAAPPTDALAPETEEPVAISSDAAAGPAASPPTDALAPKTEESVALSSHAAAGLAAAPDANAAASQIEEPVAVCSDAVLGAAAAPTADAPAAETISSDAAAGPAAALDAATAAPQIEEPGSGEAAAAPVADALADTAPEPPAKSSPASSPTVVHEAAPAAVSVLAPTPVSASELAPAPTPAAASASTASPTPTSALSASASGPAHCIGYIGSPANLDNPKTKAVICELLAGLSSCGLQVFVGKPNAALSAGVALKVEDMLVADADMFDAIIITPGGPTAGEEAKRFNNHAALYTFINSATERGHPEWFDQLNAKATFDLNDMQVGQVVEAIVSVVQPSIGVDTLAAPPSAWATTATISAYQASALSALASAPASAPAPTPAVAAATIEAASTSTPGTVTVIAMPVSETAGEERGSEVRNELGLCNLVLEDLKGDIGPSNSSAPAMAFGKSEDGYPTRDPTPRSSVGDVYRAGKEVLTYLAEPVAASHLLDPVAQLDCQAEPPEPPIWKPHCPVPPAAKARAVPAAAANVQAPPRASAVTATAAAVKATAAKAAATDTQAIRSLLRCCALRSNLEVQSLTELQLASSEREISAQLTRLLTDIDTLSAECDQLFFLSVADAAPDHTGSDSRGLSNRLQAIELHEITQRLIFRLGCRDPDVLQRVGDVFAATASGHEACGGIGPVEFRGYVAALLTQALREFERRLDALVLLPSDVEAQLLRESKGAVPRQSPAPDHAEPSSSSFSDMLASAGAGFSVLTAGIRGARGPPQQPVESDAQPAAVAAHSPVGGLPEHQSAPQQGQPCREAPNLPDNPWLHPPQQPRQPLQQSPSPQAVGPASLQQHSGESSCPPGYPSLHHPQYPHPQSHQSMPPKAAGAPPLEQHALQASHPPGNPPLHTQPPTQQHQPFAIGSLPLEQQSGAAPSQVATEPMVADAVEQPNTGEEEAKGSSWSQKVKGAQRSFLESLDSLADRFDTVFAGPKEGQATEQAFDLPLQGNDTNGPSGTAKPGAPTASSLEEEALRRAEARVAAAEAALKEAEALAEATEAEAAAAWFEEAAAATHASRGAGHSTAYTAMEPASPSSFQLATPETLEKEAKRLVRREGLPAYAYANETWADRRVYLTSDMRFLYVLEGDGNPSNLLADSPYFRLSDLRKVTRRTCPGRHLLSLHFEEGTILLRFSYQEFLNALIAVLVADRRLPVVEGSWE